MGNRVALTLIRQRHEVSGLERLRKGIARIRTHQLPAQGCRKQVTPEIDPLGIYGIGVVNPALLPV
jgi:hypothetical protein